MIDYDLMDIVDKICSESQDGFNRFSDRKLSKINSTLKKDTTRSKVSDSTELAKEAIQTMVNIPAKEAFDVLVYSLRSSNEILFRLDTGREGSSGVTNKFKFGKEVFAWAYNMSEYLGGLQGKWSAGARKSKGVEDIIYKLYKGEILAAFQLPSFSKDAFCLMVNNPLFKYALFMKCDSATSANRNLYYKAFDELIYNASANV